MATPVILKIILGDNGRQRLTLPSGMPQSLNELSEEVRKQCGLQGNFRLQFMDVEFDCEFMNLTSVDEIQDKSTLKVFPLTENSTPPGAVNYTTGHLEDCDSLFSSLEDTIILTSAESSPASISSGFSSSASTSSGSSSASTSRSSAWPDVFCVPLLTYDAEVQLERANAAFRENGTRLIPEPKLKSAILEGLTQEIVKYKVYLSDGEFDQVAASLISIHPCLSEKGSASGYGGWKTSLKYKVSNYRTCLRKLGCPEVTVNTLKHKPDGKRSPAFGIKKAKKAEVNYCPSTPIGETSESLEKMRVELLPDVKKKNSKEAVKSKMDRTFASRRQEVVRDKPMVQDLRDRWPALFTVDQVSSVCIGLSESCHIKMKQKSAHCINAPKCDLNVAQCLQHNGFHWVQYRTCEKGWGVYKREMGCTHLELKSWKCTGMLQTTPHT